MKKIKQFILIVVCTLALGNSNLNACPNIVTHVLDASNNQVDNATVCSGTPLFFTSDLPGCYGTGTFTWTVYRDFNPVPYDVVSSSIVGFTYTPSTPLPIGHYSVVLSTATETGTSCTFEVVGCCDNSCHFWAVGGNSLSGAGGSPVSPNNIIGMRGNITDPLRIFTQNTEKMRILNTGEVGIGTTAPAALGSNTALLDVVAGQRNGIYSRINPSACNTKFAIKGEVYSNSGFIFGNSSIAGYFRVVPNRRTYFCRSWAGYFDGDVNINGKGFMTSLKLVSDSILKQNVSAISNPLTIIHQLNPRSFDFRVDDYPYLGLPTEHQYGFIAQDIRNVLPGLVDTVNYAEATDSMGNVVSASSSYLSLNYTGIIPIAIAGIKQLDSIVSHLSTSGVSTSCTLVTNYLPKVTGAGSLCNSRIFDNGVGVAIGTNVIPSGYGFIVDSLKAGFREVIVACPDSAWPDYVFESTHQLAPLEEIGDYISANRHLPGIPSSNEIGKAGGINVGQMQAKQMEKIEELYRYIIVMNKNIEKLSDENQKLKEDVKRMSTKKY